MDTNRWRLAERLAGHAGNRRAQRGLLGSYG
jgi:hypothetical protein